jgi:hypothetical protein
MVLGSIETGTCPRPSTLPADPRLDDTSIFIPTASGVTPIDTILRWSDIRPLTL